MTLLSKSIHAPREREDGIRICVMRRIKDDFDFDMWWPALAPSTELLNAYNAGEVTWEKYLPRFEGEVLNNSEKMPYFQALRSLSQNTVVTLLCHEEDDEFCHRRLLIEKVRSLGGE